jgi:serine/threonine protein kinase
MTTQTTVLPVTAPYFMAPEVLIDNRYSRKSDIWSVGGAVLQMLTGDPPWKSLNFNSPLVLMYHISKVDTPPPLPASISENLRHFLLRCFDRNPATRPSAVELLNDPFLTEVDEDDGGEGDATSFPDEPGLAGGKRQGETDEYSPPRDGSWGQGATGGGGDADGGDGVMMEEETFQFLAKAISSRRSVDLDASLERAAMILPDRRSSINDSGYYSNRTSEDHGALPNRDSQSSREGGRDVTIRDSFRREQLMQSPPLLDPLRSSPDQASTQRGSQYRRAQSRESGDRTSRDSMGDNSHVGRRRDHPSRGSRDFDTSGPRETTAMPDIGKSAKESPSQPYGQTRRSHPQRDDGIYMAGQPRGSHHSRNSSLGGDPEYLLDGLDPSESGGSPGSGLSRSSLKSQALGRVSLPVSMKIQEADVEDDQASLQSTLDKRRSYPHPIRSDRVAPSPSFGSPSIPLPSRTSPKPPLPIDSDLARIRSRDLAVSPLSPDVDSTAQRNTLSKLFPGFPSDSGSDRGAKSPVSPQDTEHFFPMSPTTSLGSPDRFRERSHSFDAQLPGGSRAPGHNLPPLSGKAANPWYFMSREMTDFFALWVVQVKLRAETGVDKRTSTSRTARARRRSRAIGPPHCPPIRFRSITWGLALPNGDRTHREAGVEGRIAWTRRARASCSRQTRPCCRRDRRAVWDPASGGVGSPHAAASTLPQIRITASTVQLCVGHRVTAERLARSTSEAAPRLSSPQRPRAGGVRGG